MKRWILIVSLFVAIGCAGAPQKMPEEPTVSDKVVSPDSAVLMCDVFVQHAHKLPNKRISVVDFTEVDGSVTEQGRLLAEQIISRLSASTDLKVIERKQLNKVFEEQKLGLTGVTVDEEVEIGKILNVDAIVSGTIAHVGEYEEINARMIDTTTGEIYCAFNHRRKTTDRIQNLASAPAPKQPAVDGRFDQRRNRRPHHPDIRRLKEEHKRQLAAMRREDPRRYEMTTRTMRELEGLRREHPKAYLLATEPPGSPRVSRAMRKHPKNADALRALRKRLHHVVRTSPAYREILRIQRQEIMHRLKGKPHRQP